MTKHSPHFSDKLNRGIVAARTGQKETALQLLQEVLAVAPQTIPAMLWLAFVSPNPYDSVRLLERVLNLEPTNAQAQAGLRWARERLQTASSAPKQAAELPAPALKPLAVPSPKITQLPISPLPQPPASQSQKPAIKAAGPRRLRQLLVSVVTIALLGVVGVLVFQAINAKGDLSTLAATWGIGEVPAPVEAVVFVEPEPQPESVAVEAASQTFDTAMDTIIMQLPEISGVEAVDLLKIDEPDKTPRSEAQPVAEAALSLAASSVAPSALIGPELALISTEVEPATNLLLAHQPASPDEKWIEVNVTTQQITAWEGDQPVFSFIGSTGLPHTPTVLGKFNIYWKLESTLMTGPDYYLPEVPYTMYFYQGYALHGAYWHDNFGQPMSHGCVNLEKGDAQTLFEWADPVIPPGQTQVIATTDNPGTLVVVHD